MNPPGDGSLRAAAFRVPSSSRPACPGTSGERAHDWGSSRDEAVANACLSDQVLGSCRIIFEFLPQVPHVDAQVVAALHIGRSPDVAQELPVRQHLSWMAQEDREQTELDLGQVDALVALGDSAIRQVYYHVTKPHHGTLLFAGSGGTAQRRANPRQQLGHAEGFAQVVVRAGVERLDLIMLLDTRGQNDDGHRAPGAYLSNEVRAVTVRQTQIENDEIGLARAGFNQAALQGVRLEHAEAFRFQDVAHEAPDLLFVLDDQNSAVRVDMALSRIHGRASGSTPAAHRAAG